MEFTYNASAVAAGGVIEHSNGNKVIVPSLAPVALSPTGGRGGTLQSDYTSEAVSFSSAETRVFGSEVSKNVYTTITEVYITNLNVLDVLNIALLNATVTSTRQVNPDDPNDPINQDDDHPFELTASYHGVEVKRRLGDKHVCRVVPKIDLSMKRVKRYKHLSDLIDNASAPAEFAAPDGEMLLPLGRAKKLHERFEAKDDAALKTLLNAKRPVLGTFVEEIEDEGPPTRLIPIHRQQHKLFIPGVGTLRFGELMLKPGRRRVNLLRFSFGTIAENEAPEEEGPNDQTLTTYSGGSLTIASVEGNGSPLWP